MKKMTALVILDGFGHSEETQGNAIKADGINNISRLLKEYPHTLIEASGEDVGLPDGQMGNSEVGHMNIGAGRIVYQELTRITKSIKDGDFFENPAFLGAVENCRKHDSALHIYGLVGPAACTAIRSTSSDCWSLQNVIASVRYMYTASWMAVTFLPKAARGSSRNTRGR